MPNRSRIAAFAYAILAGVSIAALVAPSSAADYKMTVKPGPAAQCAERAAELG